MRTRPGGTTPFCIKLMGCRSWCTNAVTLNNCGTNRAGKGRQLHAASLFPLSCFVPGWCSNQKRNVGEARLERFSFYQKEKKRKIIARIKASQEQENFHVLFSTYNLADVIPHSEFRVVTDQMEMARLVSSVRGKCNRVFWQSNRTWEPTALELPVGCDSYCYGLRISSCAR